MIKQNLTNISTHKIFKDAFFDKVLARIDKSHLRIPKVDKDNYFSFYNFYLFETSLEDILFKFINKILHEN